MNCAGEPSGSNAYIKAGLNSVSKTGSCIVSSEKKAKCANYTDKLFIIQAQAHLIFSLVQE